MLYIMLAFFAPLRFALSVRVICLLLAVNVAAVRDHDVLPTSQLHDSIPDPLPSVFAGRLFRLYEFLEPVYHSWVPGLAILSLIVSGGLANVHLVRRHLDPQNQDARLPAREWTVSDVFELSAFLQLPIQAVTHGFLAITSWSHFGVRFTWESNARTDIRIRPSWGGSGSDGLSDQAFQFCKVGRFALSARIGEVTLSFVR